MYRQNYKNNTFIKCKNCDSEMPDIGIEAFDGSRVCDNECSYSWKRYIQIIKPFHTLIKNASELIKK